MTALLHTFPPQRLRQPADAIHRRLTIDPQPLAAAATADALHRSEPLLRRWGLTATTVPTVTAAATGDGELGSITIQWAGNERTTGWPAMSVRLLVTPTGPIASELTLATTRATVALAAPQLDPLHRQQATQVVVSGFLQALAEHLDDVPSRPLERMGATR